MTGVTVKKQLFLEGLDCANCASKIEYQTKKLKGVKDANMNFLNKTFTVDIENAENADDILDKINRIVHTLEPDVKVVQLDKKINIKEQQHNFEIPKLKIVSFVIGSVFFIIALIFNFSYWVEFLLFLISYLLVGKDVLIKAAKNIKKGQIFDENFLMTVASLGAFCIGEFPEGVAVMLFYNIGEFFQDLAVNKSRKSISELMDIRPDYANLQTEGEFVRVDPYVVNVNDTIIIKPGEKVPLDCIVIKGSSMLDTLALTGESMPREVNAGDEILSGMINKNSLLSVRVTKLFKDSTVSKILELVQNASDKKAETENFITKFARYYTPVVVSIALLLAFVPPVLGFGIFSDWINRALVFLVVSCPCALVLSVPLSFFSGIGAASKDGILIKGSNFLEALNDVDTVIFDKTGTLTKGVFEVTKIKSEGDLTNDEILKYAAFAESFSNHPIALSILKAYSKETDKSLIKSYEEISGHGVRIKLSDKEIIVGNKKMMDIENILFYEEKNTGTIVHVAVDKKYQGYIVISDEIREESKVAVSTLRKIGINNIVMFSGDNKSAAESIGRQLGLDEIYSELLPDKKVKMLENIKDEREGKKVLFIGDGINDAPVIARSDIGVAMGGLGSDAAIEAADIVIMNDQIYKIVNMIKIAKRTRKIVWQNIIFSLAVKAVVLVLGAVGIATMWGAVFADVGVALIAVLNATRAMRII